MVKSACLALFVILIAGCGSGQAQFGATMHLTNKEPIRSDALAASGHPDATGAPGKENVNSVIPEITMAMLRAGEEVLRAFDPEEEEDAALVAAIYWAMDAARVNLAPRE